MSLFGARTPRIPGPHSVAGYELVRMGGIDQWVLMRGHDIRNPVLLFLHGGPGGTQSATLRKFNGQLEEHFTVVSWDQRGAGKNYSSTLPQGSMTVDQILADTRDLIAFLQNRFGVTKVVLAGQSMGAALGLTFAARHPELVHAFVGINQPVNRTLEEARTHDWVLTVAKAKGVQKAVADLERIGPPVQGCYRSIQDLLKQRNWLTKFGGVTPVKSAMRIQLAGVLAPEFSWADRVKFYKGMMFSMHHLWAELQQINFTEWLHEVSCPVFFVMGRHDRIVHDQIVSYMEQLSAPHKELIVFEGAGHLACFEEPEQFHELMVGRVLPHAGQKERITHVS